MFGIFLSALFSVLGWVFKSVLVKFVAFFALFYISTEFLAYLGPKLPGAGSIQQAMAAIPPGMWYFFDLFKLGTGIQLTLAASVTAFSIRRIPVIG
jgi:hypothetical protein